MITSRVRHKVFISYHHDDQMKVDNLIKTFDEERDVFITRALGVDADLQSDRNRVFRA